MQREEREEEQEEQEEGKEEQKKEKEEEKKMKTITNTYMKALELNELEQVIGGIFPDFFPKPVPNPLNPLIPIQAIGTGLPETVPAP